MLRIAHFSKNVRSVHVKSNQMAKFRQSGHTESVISYWNLKVVWVELSSLS
jgi:hypothetical protein